MSTVMKPETHQHPKSAIVYKKKRPVHIKDDHKPYVKVYVWELPVRVFHWINAAAILLLVITGLYIGRPIVDATVQEEAYYSYLMGWVRYVHFFAAFVFTANLLIRWYWVFKGNNYAVSNPLKRAFWAETFETIKYYLLMKNNKPHYTGHNPLAQLSYWIFVGAGSIVAIFTGFYLYFEPQPQSVWAKLFVWVKELAGGDSFTVRSVHHWIAWAFILFVVIHVYMAFREDWLEKNGTMSSIFTGFKSERKDRVETHGAPPEEETHADGRKKVHP